MKQRPSAADANLHLPAAYPPADLTLREAVAAVIAALMRRIALGGRNRRHALRRANAEARFDTIVVAAASNGSPRFDADDVAWLLDNAKGDRRPTPERGRPIR